MVMSLPLADDDDDDRGDDVIKAASSGSYRTYSELLHTLQNYFYTPTYSSEPKQADPFLGSNVTEIEPVKWVISAAHNTNSVKQAESLTQNWFVDMLPS